MATNEVYKFGQWISLPLPLRGEDPHKNEDPTRNGDPVLIGDIVGVAQEVGGVPITVDTGTVTTSIKRNTSDSLEPGWASIALCGAWALPVEGFDHHVHGAGTAVGIVKATPEEPAKLVIGEGDHPFGHIIHWTKMSTKKEQDKRDGRKPGQDKNLYGMHESARNSACGATTPPPPPRPPFPKPPAPIKDPMPIVNIVQVFTGVANDVPDKPAGS